MFTVGQKISEIAETGKLWPGIITDMREKHVSQAHIKFDDGEEAWVDLTKLTDQQPKRVQ